MATRRGRLRGHLPRPAAASASPKPLPQEAPDDDPMPDVSDEFLDWLDRRHRDVVHGKDATFAEFHRYDSRRELIDELKGIMRARLDDAATAEEPEEEEE